MIISKKKLLYCSVFLGLFILLAIVINIDKTFFFDEKIYNFIMHMRCEFFDNYFVFITHFGDPIFIVLFILCFLFICRNIYGILMLVSAIDSSLITVLFKNIFVRARPDHLKLIVQDGYSFPSGHSMIAICVYGYLLYLVLKIKNKFFRYFFSTLLLILIISIGISRIYVGVHYPTDVLGGYLLGVIEVILLTEVLNLYKIRGM